MELGRECLEIWGYKRVDELIWVKTNQVSGREASHGLRRESILARPPKSKVLYVIMQQLPAAVATADQDRADRALAQSQQRALPGEFLIRGG